MRDPQTPEEMIARAEQLERLAQFHEASGSEADLQLAQDYRKLAQQWRDQAAARIESEKQEGAAA